MNGRRQMDPSVGGRRSRLHGELTALMVPILTIRTERTPRWSDDALRIIAALELEIRPSCVESEQ